MPIDFSGIGNLTGLKEELSKGVQYDWLSPILSMSLADFVRAEFELNRPSKKRYSLYDISENISNANDLANRCLSRRNNIYDLESKALQAALNYQQELALVDLDSQIAEIRMAADLTTAKDKGLIAPDLNQRRAIVKQSVMARISLHSLKGSSINYGEQGHFLRALYASDIRQLIERIYAIKLGLEVCYEYKGPLPDFPNWTDNEDDLESIVYWLRAVTQVYESLLATEHIRLAYISVSAVLERHRDGGPFSAVTDELDAFYRGEKLKFTLEKEDISSGFGDGLASNPLRIVGIGLVLKGEHPYHSIETNDEALKRNITIDNYLEFLDEALFHIKVEAPQRSSLTRLGVEDFGLIGVSASASIVEELKPSAPGSMKNFSPYGEWIISTSRLSNKPTGFSLKDIEGCLREFSSMPVYKRSIDLILCLAFSTNESTA